MIILDVIPQENYILKIFSEEGKIGYFDVKPYMNSEVFVALKNRAEFKKIFNGKYYIEWDCGADLSVDTIKAHLQIINNKEQENIMEFDKKDIEDIVNKLNLLNDINKEKVILAKTTLLLAETITKIDNIYKDNKTFSEQNILDFAVYLINFAKAYKQIK